jgi:ribosomal protein S18 acetylase RimI-like enzyme
MSISLRPVNPADEPFMFELYSNTRQEELALVNWDEAAKTAFLQMQYTAQRQAYSSQYPQATWQIILQDNQSIGRIIIDRREQEIGLMDIALLPEHCSRGIGTTLIQTVLAEAAWMNQPVRLYVEKDNYRAMRLYQRLGFVTIGETGLHWWMECWA